MTLQKYLDRFTGSERREFAKRCGLNYTHLSQLANWRRYAGGATAVAIERESGGAVTQSDLRPDWFGLGELPQPATRTQKEGAA